MSKKAKAKVLKDVRKSEGEKYIFPYLSFFASDETRVEWAIDQERDFYLFRAPGFGREAENEYRFWDRSTMYKVRVASSICSNKNTTVWRHFEQRSSVPDELKTQLTSAFALYGLYGRPSGYVIVPNPENEVVPLFVGEG